MTEVLNFASLKPHKFNMDQIEEISQHLQDYGYVVVQNMIDSVQIQSLFKKDLKEINRELPISDDISLWMLKPGIDYPAPKMPGLIGEWGMSQGRAAWNVRCNKNIQQVFKTILHTEDLVCSADAVGFSTDTEPESHQSWLHVDQNPYVETPLGVDVPSLQGIVYAEDTTDLYGASTVLVPSSHKDWLLHDFKSPNHFEIVDQIKYIPLARKLILNAGDLLILNSKTVHQGWHGAHRLCFMVSYGRKEDRSENVRRNKILMYLGGHRSTHWSQLAQYHGYKLYNVSYHLFHMIQPEIILSNIEKKYWRCIYEEAFKLCYTVRPTEDSVNMYPDTYNDILQSIIPQDILSLL